MTTLLAAISHWNPDTIAQIQKMAERHTAPIVYAVVRKRDLQFVTMDKHTPFTDEVTIRSQKGNKTAQIIRIK